MNKLIFFTNNIKRVLKCMFTLLNIKNENEMNENYETRSPNKYSNHSSNSNFPYYITVLPESYSKQFQ